MSQVNQPGQTPGQQQEMDEQLNPSVPQEADSLNEDELTEEDDEEEEGISDAGAGSDGGSASDGGAA